MTDVISYAGMRAAIEGALAGSDAESAIAITSDSVVIAAPGVTIEDFAAFAASLGAPDELLPPELPVADIALKELELLADPVDDRVRMRLVIGWAGHPIQVHPDLDISVADVTIEVHGSDWRARGDVTVRYDGLDIAGFIELPSFVIGASLDRTDPEVPATAPTAAPSVRHDGFGNATIEQVRVVAIVPLDSVAVHVAASDVLQIGAFAITWAEADFVLSGAGASRSRASVEVEMALTIEESRVLRADLGGQVDGNGWQVHGSLYTDGDLTLGTLAAALAPEGHTPDLPGAFASLAVTVISVEFDSAEGSVAVSCSVAWTDRPDTSLTIAFAHRPDHLTISGTLQVADLAFTLAFDKGTATVIVGTYAAGGAHPLRIDDLLAAFGSAVSTGLDIDVRDAMLATAGEGRVMLAADVDAGIDLRALGDLPLVGKLLAPHDSLRLALQPLFVAGQWGEEELGAARAAAPAGMTLPEEVAHGASLTASLHLGGDPINITVELDEPTSSAEPSVAAASTSPPAAEVDAITWVDVGRSFGPIHLDRAGYQMGPSDDQWMELRLDGSLVVAGLQLQLQGLGARYDFATRTLTPRLRGMGLDVDLDAVEIGGSFANDNGDFSGHVLLRTSEFALSAMGAFKMLDGVPSMFAYGVLDYPIGGPVFFFVEGLAAGFGMHRKLHLPDIDKVRSFPLVADAVGLSKGSAPVAAPADQQLARISDFVSPALGEYFLAVGLKFTSFKILNTFALLVLSVGHDVEVDLVGVSTIQSPPAPKGVPAMVRVQLNIIARLNLTEGFLEVVGTIAEGSYVYSPLCQLRGDVAFSTWFAGPNAGDFVLTMGGYAPGFVRPKHYPLARRITMTFQVTDDVSIKGDMYFALTPALLMAGGGLHAHAEFGSAEASADFTVDFLIAWEPYHYSARMHVGVRARWKCFHTSASIDLAIWGPHFSGAGRVEWGIFSFSVAFGPSLPLPPLPLTWEAFRSSFLPPDDQMVTAVVSGGLLREIDGVSVVSPAEMTVTVSSAIPQSDGGKAPALGIAPMDQSRLGKSRIDVSIWDENGRKITKAFAQDGVQKLFPAAMWGTTMQVGKNAKPISADGAIRLRPAVTHTAGSSGQLRGLDYVDDVHSAGEPARSEATYYAGDPDEVVDAFSLDDLTRYGLDVALLTQVAPQPPNTVYSLSDEVWK